MNLKCNKVWTDAKPNNYWLSKINVISYELKLISLISHLNFASSVLCSLQTWNQKLLCTRINEKGSFYSDVIHIGKDGKKYYHQQIIYPIGHIKKSNKKQYYALQVSTRSCQCRQISFHIPQRINSTSRVQIMLIFLKRKESPPAILDNKWEARLETSEPFLFWSAVPCA